MGRGMGRGMGMGLQNPYTVPQPAYEKTLTPTSRDDEKETLKRHLTYLEKQLKDVKKRLAELK